MTAVAEAPAEPTLPGTEASKSEGKKIKLTANALKLYKALVDADALDNEVSLDDFFKTPAGFELFDNSKLESIFTQELKSKGILPKTLPGAKKGRGGSRGRAKLLIHPNGIADTPATPRGVGAATDGEPKERKPRAPRGTSLATATMSVTEYNTIKKLLADHDLLRRYLLEGKTRNLFDERANRPISSAELMAIARNNDGEALEQELHRAMARRSMSYRQYLVTERNYPSELVELLGEPQATEDDAEADVAHVVARSNGQMTAPKPPVGPSPKAGTAKK